MTPALRTILFGGFRPNQLPGLAAWFRFGMDITSAAGAVSQWADQSGNGRNLIQATGTNQPALQADGSILFDGVDNLMAAEFTLNQPATVYVLGKQVAWTLFDRWTDGFAANRGSIVQQALTPDLSLYAGTDAVTAAGPATGAYAVVIAVVNGAASVMQVNNGIPTIGNAGAQNPGGFTLGAVGGGGAQWGNIQVKEVAVYAAAHDAATRALVVRYLAKVGGVSL